MKNRYFDLNIEKVLDNWEIHHAIREIIANALDETLLTNCRQPDIFKDSNDQWHIHDYGRGLNYEHFTQNQNKEKLQADNVIGKFGVGLKDALAVLNRAKRNVQIDSQYGHISLAMHEKEGFNDVQTLHAVFESPKSPDFVGTEFILDVSDEEMQRAKKLFLYFENKTPLDQTNYGDIYPRTDANANIYVNGVKVAEEDNYTFDYNITKQNASLKKALNRERSFLGRTAYSTIVKNMLLTSASLDVISALLGELKKVPEGTQRDEINYLDVQIYAVKKYNVLTPSVFMSSLDVYELSEDDKERIKQSGRELIIIPDNVYERVKDDTDDTGKKIGTIEVVQQEYSDNFKYHWIAEDQLSSEQVKVWALRHSILQIFDRQNLENKVRISTSINEITSGDTLGVWDGQNIIIKQSVLNDQNEFATVLAHELAHVISGFPDNSREFENTLSSMLGKITILSIHNFSATESELYPKKPKQSFLSRLFSN